MEIATLLIVGLFAALGVTLHSLTDNTNTSLNYISGIAGSITGYVTQIKTGLADIIYYPAINGNYYAMFCLAGMVSLTLVMFTNLIFTRGKAMIR